MEDRKRMTSKEPYGGCGVKFGTIFPGVRDQYRSSEVTGGSGLSLDTVQQITFRSLKYKATTSLNAHDDENPLYPPQTAEDLEKLQQRQDFSRTMTSSVDMKTKERVIKATFQPQLLEGKSVLDAFDRDAPWARTFHLNERNLVWHDGLKNRLYSKIAAEELSISEEELEVYLDRLGILMPDASDKMRNMNLDTLSLLIRTIDQLPYKLMMLKKVFPGANASLLAIRTPALVLSDAMQEEDLQAIADELNTMFPRLQVDKLVEENPSMLDIQGLKNALQEAKQSICDIEWHGTLTLQHHVCKLRVY